MSTTITLKAGTLQRVLANGILFAAPARDYLPALEVVRFDWDGDTLLAVATDRYVLSREQVDYEGDGNTEGRDSFSIGTADAKRVIAALKALRSPQFPVVIQYDSESAKATFTIDGDTIVVTTEHGQFPEWRRLVEAFKAGPVEQITFNAANLAALAKVQHDSRQTYLRIQLAEKGPVTATIGDRFTALVMQVREVQHAV
jgi:DNA polymerase III sliding clamp (beta) subunit (PCNA family)